MDLKKDFLAWTLVLLLVIAAIAIFDNLRTSKLAAELQVDRDHAAEKVSSLQVELENTLSEADELRNEQERLANAFVDLENEVEAMKSPVLYQDFNEAINAVEAYKAVEPFKKPSNSLR
jgi:predicted  nucleic acid-binding Zn-ribbon protein